MGGLIMYITKVGELFIPGQTRYQENVWFEYTASGPFLIFAFQNPNPKEIQAAKTGKVELALYEDGPVLFILHRIDGLEDWSDCPFSVRLCKNVEFDWSEEIQEGYGLALNIVLIDADTGILLAQRVVGTSTEFAREIRGAILRQLEHPFDEHIYNKKIDQIYSQLSSQQILRRAKAKHRAGGQ
jgi:hypothetical protein